MEKKTLSQTVIDYCNKWDVGGSLVDQKEFNDIFHHPKFFSKKRKVILNPVLKDCGIIVDSDCIFNKASIVYRNGGASLNINISVLHELTHIQMRVNPSFINEFSSPFYGMQFINMINCNIRKARLMTAEVQERLFKKPFLKINSFKRGIKLNYFELEQNGLITKYSRPTFNLNNVRPVERWGVN